jgi:hypothetical protein
MSVILNSSCQGSQPLRQTLVRLTGSTCGATHCSNRAAWARRLNGEKRLVVPLSRHGRHLCLMQYGTDENVTFQARESGLRRLSLPLLTCRAPAQHGGTDAPSSGPDFTLNERLLWNSIQGGDTNLRNTIVVLPMS